MKKICIIKLGADGDVLRTMPIARALKEKNQDSRIVWVTKGDISDLMQGNTYIDQIFTLPFIPDEKFLELYNFDLEKDACELASKIEAEKKFGFFLKEGYPAPFNIGAEYYLSTVFDDDVKKTNKKTYQEMMFMAAELRYQREYCPIYLSKQDLDFAKEFTNMNYLHSEKLIGIHMGASSRWPSKVWSEIKQREFIIKAKEKGYEIILFGGPNEIGKLDFFSHELEKKLIRIYRNDPHNSKREFASLVSLCKVIVCSDSFALHVALGLGKKAIGLFFVTSPDEVEGYGFLSKIVSSKLPEFFPEKSDQFNEDLVNSISADEVLNAVEKAMKN
ncbi:glycosyltransferase family 9 protein [Candidatus Pacearchaeota archaeon]|nr:glycosyltransferase family 9 protein [Candidatus Pacearchaeota archaeon]